MPSWQRKVSEENRIPWEASQEADAVDYGPEQIENCVQSPCVCLHNRPCARSGESSPKTYVSRPYI